MTVLTDFQYEIGDVILGAGTPFRIAEIEGLGPSELRTADVEPPEEDGTWLGVDYFQGRVIRMDAGIRVAGDPGGVLDQLAALTAIVTDSAVRGLGGTTTDLRMKLPGRDVRVVRGRLRRAKPTLAQVIHGWAPLDLEFQAADHLFYADTSDTVSIPLGVIATGGFTAPVVAPIVVNSLGDTTRPGWVDNTGSAPTWPILTVTGPCANPTITHVETGLQLAFTGTLGVGEWVEIDTRPTKRSVTRSGGGITSLKPVSRIDRFQLPPGLSEIRWNATDPTNTCSLAVTWWPAFTAL